MQQQSSLAQPNHIIQSQNYTNTQNNQTESTKNEIPLPYYLQQDEISKNQYTNVTQLPNTAESLQMITMNP